MTSLPLAADGFTSSSPLAQSRHLLARGWTTVQTWLARSRSRSKQIKLILMKKFLLTLITMGAFAGLANAQCSELFISEYQEGYNNNKALEIFNPTANAITLTGNYRIVRWSNGVMLPMQMLIMYNL